jgi:hypothetical protein
MKISSIPFACFLLLAFVADTRAQQPFAYPLKVGEVQIYNVAEHPDDPRDPSYRGQLIRRVFKATAREGNTDGIEDTVRICEFSNDSPMGSYSLTINARGRITEIHDSTFWIERFPLMPILRDSVAYFHRYLYAKTPPLDSMECRLIRMGPREMFGKVVRVFALTDRWGLNDGMHFIADTFGVVVDSGRYDFGIHHQYLQSAVINGVEYNIVRVPIGTIPLCGSNEYQYGKRLYSPTRDSLFTVHAVDTAISGTIYTRLPGLALPLAWPAWYRSDAAGLSGWIDGRDSLILPSTAWIGMPVMRGCVTNIHDTLLGGRARHVVTVQQILEGRFDFITFIEDVGIGKLWQKGTVSELIFASACGTEYGTKRTVAVPPAEQPAPVVLLPNAPNPFSESTLIRYHLAQPGRVTILVTDLLGREVATLYERIEQPGFHAARFDPASIGAGLPAGWYFYRMLTPQATRTRSMLYLR